LRAGDLPLFSVALREPSVMGIKVLLVEDDRALREALADTLLLGGHDYSRRVGRRSVGGGGQEAFSLVVSDVNMPGMDGHQLLAAARASAATAGVADDRARRRRACGRCDAPGRGGLPGQAVRAQGAARPGGAACLGSLGASESEGPVAFEPASAQLLELAARVARSDSTVLISGESGTGKEVLARYIHQQSHRASQPFIAINCAAIPDNMLEATLFGHEKGSFTGAIAAQAGKFEQADGGTILLDEISEMPLGLQAKLLRVLQEREGARRRTQADHPGYSCGRHHQPRPGRGSGGGALP
jgi:two-component system response regulator FlrC